MVQRGTSLCCCLFALSLASACEDEAEQRFPFTYDIYEDTTPALEQPAAPGDAAVVDAGFAEPLDAGADDSDAGAGDGGADSAPEDLADAGEGAGSADAEDELFGGGESTSESADESGGASDEEVFGGDEPEASAEGAFPPRGGGQGAGAGAPAQRRGPVLFPPYAPRYLDPGPLWGGENLDVAALSGGYTAVVVNNVALRLDDDVNVFVVSLTGVLVPLGMDLVDLDQPRSLQLIVDEAELRVSEEDLARIFSRYLFDSNDDSFGDDDFGDESPLRDVTVTLERGRVHLVAELDESGDDIELRGTLEPTVGGDVALIPTAMRRDDKPVDSLDDIFEEGLAGAGRSDDTGGALGGFGGDVGPAVWLDADALYFDPEAILRGPALDAQVIDVETRGKYVRLLLEGPAPNVKTLGPAGDVKNYVELRGGALRFGKLIMPRADVLLIDADPSDPFDLSLRRYDEQMVAGSTDLRADLGLRVTMPDFDEAEDMPLDEEGEDDELFGDGSSDGGDEGDAGDQDEDDAGEDGDGEDRDALFE